jgi:4'-phosphopantetheinyl transferase EntD
MQRSTNGGEGAVGAASEGGIMKGVKKRKIAYSEARIVTHHSLHECHNDVIDPALALPV